MFSRINLLLAFAFMGTTLAAPHTRDSVKRDSAVDDITVLQYAANLEHLENNFYSGALAKFDAAAFKKAGFPSWVRGRFAQIAEHEASHVAFLTEALGDNAIKACEYSFPYTDPKSFATLSMILEGVGTAAYLGAAKFIQNKDYLTAAGSILATEARHDAWVSSAVNKGAAWNLPYETPLGFNGVFSLASQFITDCPSTNPNLPVKFLPTLTIDPATPTPGKTVSISTSGIDGTVYIAWFYGLQVIFSDIANNKTTVPSALLNAGTVYAAVVSSNSGTPSDDSLLSGLAVVEFPFSADAKQN